MSGNRPEAIKTLTAGGAKAMFLNSVCVDWDTLGQRWAGYSPTAGGEKVKSIRLRNC